MVDGECGYYGGRQDHEKHDKPATSIKKRGIRNYGRLCRHVHLYSILQHSYRECFNEPDEIMIVIMITMMIIAIPFIAQARSIQFSPGMVKHLLPTADVCIYTIILLHWPWYVMFRSKLPRLR